MLMNFFKKGKTKIHWNKKLTTTLLLLHLTKDNVTIQFFLPKISTMSCGHQS